MDISRLYAYKYRVYRINTLIDRAILSNKSVYWLSDTYPSIWTGVYVVVDDTAVDFYDGGIYNNAPTHHRLHFCDKSGNQVRYPMIPDTEEQYGTMLFAADGFLLSNL